MRMLQCFHDYLRPTEQWVYRLISALPGTEVFIAARTYRKTNFYDPAFRYMQYPLAPFPKTISSPWLYLADKIGHQFRKRYTYERYIADMSRHHGIRLMHSHFAHVGWEYREIAKALNIPHLISFYGIDYECLPYREPLWKERYRELFGSAHAFVCEGNNGAGLLEQSGCPAEKIHVVHLGVDTDAIPFVKRTKKRGELKLLQMASYTEKKGHIYSLRAFEKALKTCPEMELTFVGGAQKGKLYEELRAYVREKGLDAKLRFLDFVDYRKLHEFMGAFHVFIHPSVYAADRNCEGGAPVVLLDAQASGMPVISTSHCDIPDEVIDGETGLLAGEKDVEQLCAHIASFYRMDSEAYRQYALRARAHVLENYNVNRSADALKAIYLQLI